MSTQIDIIIYSLDKDNIYILSKDSNNNSLPNIPLSTEYIESSNLDPQYYISQTIQKYTNIDIAWAKPKLIDIGITVEESNLVTHIYYACYIPYIAKTNGHWIAVDKNIVTNKIIQKILFYV